ncbi:hypothetical protein Bca52824_001574 [Brassica carinata]|uniref:Ankyrin repeat family protein n=1 Tax=Brassica carinata TaxID=52824 RepID=A0A8X7WIK8_BRACI|nr:hypothetical protein Bca52824_001574 [Brassica carinata]
MSVSKMVAQDANLNERSNTSTQDENIYEKLKKAAQDGDIERLYKLIAEDQDILCQFDKNSLFVRHHYTIAAEKRQTHFAIELLTLNPSYAIKLNWRGFVALNSSLVSIKGRGRITPLHHVARTDVHIALKNHQLMVFKVLLGWLKRVNKEEILDWKDEDGNTGLI